MRILYIADSTSIHTVRWLKYFRDRGHEIFLVTIGRVFQAIPGITHVHHFGQFYYFSPSFPLVLARTIRAIKGIRPHIVHAHSVHQYGWLGAMTGFHPFVMTAWGTDIFHLPYASKIGIGRFMTRYAMLKADVMTAISYYLKREMVKLGANAGKIHVVNWGVDLSKFNTTVEVTQEKQRLSIGNQPSIYTNRLHLPLYNNDIIVRAFAQVASRFPEAVLIMQNAGGEPDRNLVQLASRLEIERSIRFIPRLLHADLPRLYALADVYVSVPSWDAGPISMLEAMACGAVPVVSNIPAPMEWIKDNENGRVVPLRDPCATAEAICDLLQNPTKREAFSLINRRLIAEKAQHHACMDLMDRLYNSLV